jgi:hypothetical protein
VLSRLPPPDMMRCALSLRCRSLACRSALFDLIERSAKPHITATVVMRIRSKQATWLGCVFSFAAVGGDVPSLARVHTTSVPFGRARRRPQLLSQPGRRGQRVVLHYPVGVPVRTMQCAVY